MNLQTIQMDQRIARIHYADYRKEVRKHREKREQQRIERAAVLGKELRQVRIEKEHMELEDEMLLGAYRVLMKGDRIIDIHQTIEKAGVNAEQLPKLAIAPAHGKQCWLSAASNAVIFRVEKQSYRCPVANQIRIELRTSDMGARLSNYSWRTEHKHPHLSNVVAVVPTVPPELRPDKLDDYHILWEAEWKKCAPVDPVLLRRINNRFFTVVAQWDLTPLERSVLEGRL